MLDVMPLSKQQVPTELKALLSPASVFKLNEPLAKKTTLRVGGPADFYIEPASENELAQVVRFCRQRDVPFFLLGRGSNLLIRDGGIRGVVICLAHPSFAKIQIERDRLICGAG